ncbi:hypothetical protein [Pectobacterium colocasium]|uniref:hypothetical protein n=1 Tax=Pectobacterium colocasium TaxID=2878098 RepID=UPI003B27EFDD
MSNKRRLKKNPLEDTAMLSRIAQAASQKAIKEAFAAGMAIHYISEGKQIKAHPDGRKECVKELGMNPILLRELLE